MNRSDPTGTICVVVQIAGAAVVDQAGIPSRLGRGAVEQLASRQSTGGQRGEQTIVIIDQVQLIAFIPAEVFDRVDPTIPAMAENERISLIATR